VVTHNAGDTTTISRRKLVLIYAAALS
jgi:hypothetical protein